MSRFKNEDWSLSQSSDGTVRWEAVHSALLMDLRDELKEIVNRLRPLTCRNFIDIPARLSRIARHTKPAPKPKVRRKLTRGL